MKIEKKGRAYIESIESEEDLKKRNDSELKKKTAKDAKATQGDKLDYIIDLLEGLVK